MTGDLGASNGQIGVTRVQFDRADVGRTVDVTVAAEMLMSWRERNPGQFGYWLAMALTGAVPSRTARSQ
jgi:hypothetical protein